MCQIFLVVHLWLLLLPFGSKSLQQGEDVDYSFKSHNLCDATDIFSIFLSSLDRSSAFVSTELCSLGFRSVSQISFPVL